MKFKLTKTALRQTIGKLNGVIKHFEGVLSSGGDPEDISFIKRDIKGFKTVRKHMRAQKWQNVFKNMGRMDTAIQDEIYLCLPKPLQRYLTEDDYRLGGK